MGVVKNRPYFGPAQIRSSKEISLGDKVIPVYLDVEWHPVEIIGYFSNSVGRGFLIIDYYGNRTTMYYADRGLAEYTDGWNKFNWLKRVKLQQQ